MKNKIEDVRNHLVAMMEALGDDNVQPEEMARRIERAKTMSLLTDKYIGAVKVEIDGARLLHDTGLLPTSISEPGEPPKLPRPAAGISKL